MLLVKYIASLLLTCLVQIKSTPTYEAICFKVSSREEGISVGMRVNQGVGVGRPRDCFACLGVWVVNEIDPI